MRIVGNGGMVVLVILLWFNLNDFGNTLFNIRIRYLSVEFNNEFDSIVSNLGINDILIRNIRCYGYVCGV